MQDNKVYHGDFLSNTLPDKSVQLLIADPPYFQVKGKFDFIWASFDDYLKDVERWAQECKRILADNGTLFWWGMDRKIAYAQVVFDKYFELIGTLVWEKSSIANEWESRRTFPERGQERLLMYSNECDDFNTAESSYSLAIGLKHTEVMRPLVDYMIGEMKNAGHNCASVNKATSTCMASHWFARTSQWSLPTKEWYEKLRLVFGEKHLRREYEELRREYEELRREYEELRRPFNNQFKLTDVLRFNQQPNKYDHPTKKPEKLTRALILTCSRPNDLVFVPFAGSGTECAMAAKEGRRFIGFDVEEKYVAMSNERAKPFLTQSNIFHAASPKGAHAKSN